MQGWIRAAISAVVTVALSVSVPAQAAPRSIFDIFGIFGDRDSRVTLSRPGSSRYVSAVYRRQLVAFNTREKAGTIIIDTGDHFLYLVVGEGQAIRYGIGVARDGFEWSGTHRVSRKAEWPGWTPPVAMRQRQPGLPAYMPGGPDNPLGARALYLGSSLYRIHGTAEPWTIGQNVSSGCIRLTNEDVIDLYSRVPVGTKVLVL